MPPSATIVDCESIDGIFDVGGIEVEQVTSADSKSLMTKISLLPWEETFAEDDSSRYAYFQPMAMGEIYSAESFDSVDQIDEDSNEAKLIKSIARKAILANDDLPFLDETEAQYLDVLDKHIEETDPEMSSFADLESEIDGVHPIKNQAKVDEIMEHFLDSTCCQCNPSTPATRPLNSALKSPKWSSRNGQYNSQDHSQGRTTSPNSNSVTFKNVDIREFRMTLGDHPSACSGPPVRLDWDSTSQPCVIELEEYEKERQPRRSRRQLKLSLQRRHNILVKERGFSFEEVKAAWHDALEIRRLRKETLERGLGLMKWDEVWESTCRKFNRLVDY